jgi:xanthine dehydrogenase YagR molybdenum-binding subunit
VHLDVQEIDVMWADIPIRCRRWARGIGEIGITDTAAAIAKAVFNATGRHVRDLLIMFDKLLRRPSPGKPCGCVRKGYR